MSNVKIDPYILRFRFILIQGLSQIILAIGCGIIITGIVGLQNGLHVNLMSNVVFLVLGFVMCVLYLILHIVNVFLNERMVYN